MAKEKDETLVPHMIKDGMDVRSIEPKTPKRFFFLGHIVFQEYLPNIHEFKGP